MALCVYGHILPPLPTLLPWASTTPANTQLLQKFIKLKAQQHAVQRSNNKRTLVAPVFNSSLVHNISDTQRIAFLSRLGGCLWHYSGVLRSPSTGSVLVGVQGLEYVHLLDVDNNGGSYVSRKVFVYTDLTEENDYNNHIDGESNRHSNLRALKQYRVRPNAPKRRVRSSKIFNEIVSFQTDRNTSRVFTSIQFPNKRRIRSTKFTLKDNTMSTLEQSPLLSRLIKPLTSYRNEEDFSVVALIRGVGTAAASNATRKINKWISFASPEDSIHGRSQEHYRISSSSSLAWGIQPRESRLLPVKGSGAFLFYKRFGEGPPWYSPGKSVLTELHACKFETSALIKAVPQEVLRLICEECPDYFPTDVRVMIPHGNKGGEVSFRQTIPGWFDEQKDTYDDYKVWWKRIIGK